MCMVLMPRVINGTVAFSPNAPGTYYVVLDNRHSTFTTKTVKIEIYEQYLIEEEAELPKEKEPLKAEPKPFPPPARAFGNGLHQSCVDSLM